MACVLGCGIDIEEHSRFAKHIIQQGVTPLIEHVFTPKEIRYNLEDRSCLRFALGFSCKESVFKALGVSWTNSPILWTDIELLWKDKEDLYNHEIRLHHYAEELFQNQKGNQIISDLEFNDEIVFFKVMIVQ